MKRMIKSLFICLLVLFLSSSICLAESLSVVKVFPLDGQEDVVAGILYRNTGFEKADFPIYCVRIHYDIRSITKDSALSMKKSTLLKLLRT